MKDKKDIIKVLKSKYFIISGIIVLIIGAYLAYTASLSKQVKAWDNKTYPGVTVKGVDLGGKTKEEVAQILNEKFSSQLSEKAINITVENKKLSYKYGDLNAKYNIDEVAEEAVLYGKDTSAYNKNKLIKNKSKETHEIQMSLVYDETQIGNIEKDIKKAVDISPVNATISKSGDSFNISSDKVGYTLDSTDLDAKMKEALNGNLGESTDLTFNLKEVQAKVKKSDLAKINGKMSTFSTQYKSSTEDRSYNIEFVTSLLNGTVLMPGEEFSYGELSQRGKGKYKIGTMYVNNKVVPAEAGGVCQVSSTLYNAAMQANIRSTERRNHSLPVGYVAPGLDATMAWGGVDYKFKNPYDFPIYIEGYTQNKVVTINIYGRPSALDGKTYKLVSEDLGTIPQTIKYKDDASLPKGTEVVEVKGAAGRKARAYLVTYKDGKQINKELISTDTYAPQQKVIRRGTGPVAEPNTPESTDKEATGTPTA